MSKSLIYLLVFFSMLFGNEIYRSTYQIEKQWVDNNMLQRDEIPRRQISSEFLLSAIPAIVVFVIAALVLFALFCYYLQGLATI